jgi:hypothetical protein
VKPVWSVGIEKLFIAGNTSEIKILKNAHSISNSNSNRSTGSATANNNALGMAQSLSRVGRENKPDVKSNLSAMLCHSAPSAAAQLLDLSSDFVDTSREGRAMESRAMMALEEAPARRVGGREGPGCSPYTPSRRDCSNSTALELGPVTSPVPVSVKEQGMTGCGVEGLGDAGCSARAAPRPHTQTHTPSTLPKAAVKMASGEEAFEKSVLRTGEGDGDGGGFVYCPASDLRKRVNSEDTDPFPFCSYSSSSSSSSTFSTPLRSGKSSAVARNQSDSDSEIKAKMEISLSCTIIGWMDGTTGEEKSFELEEENEKEKQRISDIKLELERQESRTSKSKKCPPRVSSDRRRSSFSTSSSTSIPGPNASATNKSTKSSMTGGAERREKEDFSSVSSLTIHLVNEESRMGIILDYKVHTVLLPHLMATWLMPGREIEIFSCLVSDVDASKDLIRVSRSDHTIVKGKGDGKGEGERGVDERKLKRSVSLLDGHGHGYGPVSRLSATRPYSGIRRRSSLGVGVGVTSGDGHGQCGKRDLCNLLSGGDTGPSDALAGGDGSIDSKKETKKRSESSAVTAVRRNNIIENEKNRYRALCLNNMEFLNVSTHLIESCARYRINNVNVRIIAVQEDEQPVGGTSLDLLRNRSELDNESKIEERHTTNAHTVPSGLEFEGSEGRCPSLPVKRARMESPGPGGDPSIFGGAHSSGCNETTGTDRGCLRQARGRDERSHGQSCSALVLVMVSNAHRAERMYIDRDSVPQLLSCCSLPGSTSSSTLRCDIVFARISDPCSATGMKSFIPRACDDNEYSDRALQEDNLDDVSSHWRIVWINVRH